MPTVESFSKRLTAARGRNPFFKKGDSTESSNPFYEEEEEEDEEGNADKRKG